MSSSTPPPATPARRLASVARPKQARSRETLQRILDAAEGLIVEKGLADASIPEIVRRAGSSVGGFYARFRDKDELLRALEERFFVEMSERVEALSAEAHRQGVGVAQVVTILAHELVATTRARQNLITAFLHRATWDEGTRREALRFRGRVAERVKELVLGAGQALDHPEPPLAVDLAVQIAFGLVFQLVMVGEVRAGGRVLGDAELEREIARSFLRVIGVPDAETPAGLHPEPPEEPRS